MHVIARTETFTAVSDNLICIVQILARSHGMELPIVLPCMRTD